MGSLRTIGKSLTDKFLLACVRARKAGKPGADTSKIMVLKIDKSMNYKIKELVLITLM